MGICLACGAYGYGSIDSLARPCPHQPPSVALRRQLNRIAKGLFPGWAPQYKGWRIGNLFNPSIPQLASLLGRRAASYEWGPSQVHTPYSHGIWGPRWDLAQLLIRFGLTPESVQHWIQQAQEQEKPAQDHGDSSDDEW